MWLLNRILRRENWKTKGLQITHANVYDHFTMWPCVIRYIWLNLHPTIEIRNTLIFLYNFNMFHVYNTSVPENDIHAQPIPMYWYYFSVYTYLKKILRHSRHNEIFKKNYRETTASAQTCVKIFWNSRQYIILLKASSIDRDFRGFKTVKTLDLRKKNFVWYVELHSKTEWKGRRELKSNNLQR